MGYLSGVSKKLLLWEGVLPILKMSGETKRRLGFVLEVFGVKTLQPFL
jgi:hypothetical protein